MVAQMLRSLKGFHIAGAMIIVVTLSGCPTPLAIDYNTQLIVAGENALEGKTLYFMPDGSLSFYSRTVIDGISSFPVDPATGTEVDFTKADPFEVPLSSGQEIIFYGRAYDSIFIGSDGVVSFGEAGAGNSSLQNHFSTPQVSILPVDATRDNGSVSYEIRESEVIVTFANVLVGNTSNSFQAEFFILGAEDGDLALSYPVTSKNVGGIVGLSNGQIQGANQAQIDAFFAGFAESNLVTNNTGTSKLTN